ncbi:flavin reductase family protein [Pseudomonas tolaasii]|uniref:flavin reductase family protein n=1 Tax=Pseudomonas tolaasii TaxID=29442 RepID=UPI001C5F7339|nr:flavin reductase family protein [Pseudomonas tolaasii]MBW4793233.1 flavin reductase family protein [Pseudomonas tolaasii]
MRRIDASRAYRILESGPVVMVCTQDEGRRNVMTMGFHMMVQHAPPLIGCIIGPWDHSFAALRRTRQCVIAVPGVDLAQTVVDIGNCSGAETDKFARFNLTTAKPAKVDAPLLRDCLYNIECVTHDDEMVEKYQLFILEAVAIWVNDERQERRCLHHHGDGTFTADGERIDLRQRMTRWKQFQVEL